MLNAARHKANVRCHSEVPPLRLDRLSTWCVLAAVAFLILGFSVMRGAASVDVTVLGGALMELGCALGLLAFKLDPRVVKRFFRD